MWEYNHTETMFDNTNELYHTDIYLGQDYSDGIRHFKYIKRVKKNGRWVYYYKDDKFKKAIKNYEKKYNTYKRNADKESNLKSDRKSYAGYLDDSKKHSSKIARKSMESKWYEFGKKNALKKDYELSKSNEKKFKKKLKQADKGYKKYKTKTKQSLIDAEIARDELRREHNKDRGKKIVSKMLVGGLNATELTKQAAKKASKKMKKELKEAPKNIEKGVKEARKNIKKGLKETGKAIKDEYRYKEARIKGYSSYTDSDGRTRLTEATKIGREPVDMKKNNDGSRSITAKGEKDMRKYRELKKEEDRINKQKKKKRSK